MKTISAQIKSKNVICRTLDKLLRGEISINSTCDHLFSQRTVPLRKPSRRFVLSSFFCFFQPQYLPVLIHCSKDLSTHVYNVVLCVCICSLSIIFGLNIDRWRNPYYHSDRVSADERRGKGDVMVGLLLCMFDSELNRPALLFHSPFLLKLGIFHRVLTPPPPHKRSEGR